MVLGEGRLQCESWDPCGRDSWGLTAAGLHSPSLLLGPPSLARGTTPRSWEALPPSGFSMRRREWEV